MKKENKPALSVFVLFYNHEKFVTTCLESVFSEDLSGVEVIISDDCSADSTFGICKKYISTKKSNASRVLLNRNRKNLGINAHVNKLVDLANADVFLPLAGDDWFARDKIQRIKKEIQKSKYSMYVSDCYIANSEGIVIKEYNFNDKKPWPALKIAENGGANIPGHSQAVWRRELFSFFGPLDEKILNEDDQLVFRAMLLNGICVINEPLNHYRLHPESVSSWWKNPDIDYRSYIKKYIAIMSNIENTYVGWLIAAEVACKKGRISEAEHELYVQTISDSIREIVALRNVLDAPSFFRRVMISLKKIPSLRNRYSLVRLTATISPGLLYVKMYLRGKIRKLYYRFIRNPVSASSRKV